MKSVMTSDDKTQVMGNGAGKTAGLTPRERFRRVMAFEKSEGRLPMVEWAAWWDVTTDRWKAEGLPAELDWEGTLRHFGLDVLVCIGTNPMDWNLIKDLPHGHGIIQNQADYDRVKPRLYSEENIAGAVRHAVSLRERHERGEVIIRIWLDGFFWYPRSLFGIENHLFAFYDHPELMHQINRDLTAFNIKYLNAVLDVLTPDMVGFAEDMSYNNGPMLSKEAFDEFLLPYYRQVVPVAKARGVPVLVDTDGMLEDMIPWLLDAGMDGIYPLERQSGVDVARIRKNYPRLLMMGGYDKMMMNKGEVAMRAEFERLLPVMRTGGFIPSVDHQTPPGVSLDNYRSYIRLFGEYAARACGMGAPQQF
jgi:uroporphyrinogen-III decarboxylase